MLRTEPDWTLLPADLPPALDGLLRRCLERDLRNRLRDIGEARVALAEKAPAVAALWILEGFEPPRASWGNRFLGRRG